MPDHIITKSTSLLDDKGLVIEPGFSKQPNWVYDQKYSPVTFIIKVFSFRQKSVLENRHIYHYSLIKHLFKKRIVPSGSIL